VTTAFEGTDKSSAAFATAGQVKKLNSFSLISVYFQAKQAFFDVVSSLLLCIGSHCSDPLSLAQPAWC